MTEITKQMVERADMPYRDWLLYALVSNPPSELSLSVWKKCRALKEGGADDH